MSRYIDANKIRLISKLVADENGDILVPLSDVRRAIEQTPTENVVEVVRCKDCEYCRISIDTKTNISVQVCGYVGYNPVQSSQVTDNDYCSHGERRE